MARERATNLEGITAIYHALVVSLVTSDISKKEALEIFSECWEKLAPTIKAKWDAGHD